MDGDDISQHLHDRAPGVRHEEPTADFLTYTAGLVFAVGLTIMSFLVSQTDLLWAPGVATGLVVLAIAQIGVHLVFFLHMGTGPDHTNNIIALTFGMFIVFLVIAGSCWIVFTMNANMMNM
jgi:cytochrome o ubiquinol oxidase operon protein cyoD